MKNESGRRWRVMQSALGVLSLFGKSALTLALPGLERISHDL